LGKTWIRFSWFQWRQFNRTNRIRFKSHSTRPKQKLSNSTEFSHINRSHCSSNIFVRQ
jgi:hypothetical protein